MSAKALVFIGMSVGSLVGGYIPVLWGGSLLSFSSILLSGAGAIIGIIICYKLSQ